MLVATAGVAAALIDENRVYKAVSPTYAAAGGCLADDLVGKPLTNIFQDVSGTTVNMLESVYRPSNPFSSPAILTPFPPARTRSHLLGRRHLAYRPKRIGHRYSDRRQAERAERRYIGFGVTASDTMISHRVARRARITAAKQAGARPGVVGGVIGILPPPGVGSPPGGGVAPNSVTRTSLYISISPSSLSRF